MRNLGRLPTLILPLILAALAQPVAAATQTATVNANVVKPLILTSVQNLDLGTITLVPGSWSSATVGISRAGVFSCPGPGLICTGAVQVAKCSVSGASKAVVVINAPNVSLVNQTDTTKTLTLVVDSPRSVTLPNAGTSTPFSLGGTITLGSDTAPGDYQGTFDVTVDYQ